jgi:hypothetical protein
MNPEHEYRDQLTAFLAGTVFGQEEPQETPQQHGHGSVDGGAHGPEPTRTKTESDFLLDAIFDADHYQGQAWTGGGGGR